MSVPNWIPGANPPEREEFIKGLLGASPIHKRDVLLAIIAGYVGGKIVKRTGNK